MVEMMPLHWAALGAVLSTTGLQCITKTKKTIFRAPHRDTLECKIFMFVPGNGDTYIPVTVLTFTGCSTNDWQQLNSVASVLLSCWVCLLVRPSSTKTLSPKGEYAKWCILCKHRKKDPRVNSPILRLIAIFFLNSFTALIYMLLLLQLNECSYCSYKVYVTIITAINNYYSWCIYMQP